MDSQPSKISPADDGPSTLQGWTDGLHGWTTDGLSSLHGWTATNGLAALDDGPSTAPTDGLSALLSLHGATTAATNGLFTLDKEPSHTCTTFDISVLNLSGLSDVFDDLASALGSNTAIDTPTEKPKHRGSSLSDQLQDEPGLFDTLKDLGFEETPTGNYKNC